jgi:hypothetical protein
MELDTRTLLSSTAPSARIFAVTFFRGPFATIPSTEEAGLTASQIIDRTAPEDGPRLAEDKARVPYFVPCALKVAPFVGKTAERYPGQSGKQRSASHVTAGALFPNDFDGITPEDKARILGRLVGSGVLFCAYSTYSHGKNPDEVRMRVLVFVDRTLEPLQWADVWHVLNRVLFDGLADVATAKLSQQAGVWATHPGREGAAFRVMNRGALLSADALLALVPPKVERPRRVRPKVSGAALTGRYADALAMTGAESFAPWMTGLSALKAAVLLGELPEDDAAGLWFAFSESGSDAAKAHNDDKRYDPAHLWEAWEPTAAPAEGLVGKLFANARDAALSACRADVARAGHLTDEGLRAARYLAKYHPRAFDELTTEVRA